MTTSLLSPRSLVAPPPPAPRPRFLSEADCHEIAHRVTRAARGGGETTVHIVSAWVGSVRWARNRITAVGEDRDAKIEIWRILQGAPGVVSCNATTDDALATAVRQAERVAQFSREEVEADLTTRPGSPFRPQDEPAAIPNLFSAATYTLDAEHQAAAARQLMQSATAAGMLSAGYAEVSAVSFAYLTSWGYARYFQYTWAQCSMTVRDPTGVGSGWAGVDWPDWSRIDGDKLSAIALDKCVKSRNPVAVEPGRYTTILEPQAVCDFVGQMMFNDGIGRGGNETSGGTPFHKSGRQEPPNIPPGTLGLSRLGEQVIDERLTISADPLDPELGFPPYDKLQSPLGGAYWDIYHPATWIEQGVLKSLSYDRDYAAQLLGRNTGLPNSGAFRMSVSGATTSVEEMIATTKRGILVTRFDQVQGPQGSALVCRGYTRDGLWFIENGKLSKPISNMLFVESILFALNNVEQAGDPQRVFHPLPGGTFFAFWANPQPVIVPPLKIKDFSFVALSDAI